MTYSRLKLTVLALIMGVLLFGCGKDKTVVVIDDTAPGIPRGVYTVTGDGQVIVIWYGSSEDDLDYYVIWRAKDEVNSEDDFDELDVIDAGAWDPNLPDFQYVDAQLTNGRTYFYAVSAVDFDGNESALSYASDPAFDTPRPEGYNVFLDGADDDIAGFDFNYNQHDARVVPAGHLDANIEMYYDSDYDVIYAYAVYINASNFNDIQDFGYTDDLDALDWAPTEGWSYLGWTEMILGHTYVVWTNDNHFAKFRVIAMGDTWVRIDWAYQTVEGYQELKIGPNGRTAPSYEGLPDRVKRAARIR